MLVKDIEGTAPEGNSARQAYFLCLMLEEEARFSLSVPHALLLLAALEARDCCLEGPVI